MKTFKDKQEDIVRLGIIFAKLKYPIRQVLGDSNDLPINVYYISLSEEIDGKTSTLTMVENLEAETVFFGIRDAETKTVRSLTGEQVENLITMAEGVLTAETFTETVEEFLESKVPKEDKREVDNDD